MKEQILSILNENSAELTVEKAWKIAEILVEPLVKGTVSYKTYNTFHQLLESFESFKKIRLEKGQFVCEVEKPNYYDYHTKERVDYGLYLAKTEEYEIEAYELALQKVIFAGFEGVKKSSDSWLIEDATHGDNPLLRIEFYSDIVGGGYMVKIGDNVERIISSFSRNIDTIGDLETEISRYNRTAKEPINLKFTENILPLLGVKI